MTGIERRAAPPVAAAGAAGAIAGEAGAGLSGELAARVVLGHELDVPMLDPAVFGLVLDAEVGQFEMTSHD